MDEENKQPVHRIRFGDEEDGHVLHERAPQHHRRQSSVGSLSIRSSVGAARTFQPETALPITYRTLSIEVDEDLHKRQEGLGRAKEKAAVDLAALDWHTLTVDELCRRLSVDIACGLSEDQIKHRTGEYGQNKMTSPPSGLFGKITGYFFGGFGGILVVAGILVFIAWKPLGSPPAVANLALACVLIAVWIVQAAFNAWQDWSTSQLMASIALGLPDQCIVIRNESHTRVSAVNLVPGDVIVIKHGNKLPADVRLVEVSSDAMFDRSILTGESEPVVASVQSTEENYLETNNIGPQGTYCISGSCLGVCVATGDNTIFGRIAKLTSDPKTGMTPLQKEILRFVSIISVFITCVVILIIVLWAAWLKKAHPEWINVPLLIVSCVSAAVAFIPEGLPIALTTSLTITANMMRKNKILCKSLKTVETLGSVSVICSDKTGTLTKNTMVVTDTYAAGEEFTPEAARNLMAASNSENNATYIKTRRQVMNELRMLSGLCNSGEFDAATMHKPIPERTINGDATDKATLAFSETLGSVAELRRDWKLQFEIAFNSKRKFMVRLMTPANQNPTSNNTNLMIKGAPDVLMPWCDTLLNDNAEVVPLTDGQRLQIERVKDSWSRQGKRVILLARKPTVLPSSDNREKEVLAVACQGLTLVGLLGIVDPLRDEIPEVVRTLRGASIRIFMVTGDFKLTAQAIAESCGIISNPELVDGINALDRDGTSSTTKQAIVLSGTELITLNEAQWDVLAKYEEIVFARTTPEQKLRIVKELQAREYIVGMTGDGVNDAPSLKTADIGIAMGSGSDIAIEAADMVLLDSFAAIVQAVLYGRLVFFNLRKTITYLLPAGSFSELWPVITNVAFGIPQILSSFLMIIICCFTDCAAAITLAYEKPEADLMLRPPRNPRKDRLVDARLIFHAYFVIGLIQCFCSFTMAFWYMSRKGVPFTAMWLKFGKYDAQYDPAYITEIANTASSIYFVTLVVMQLFNLLATRTRRLSIFQQPPLFNKETQNWLVFPAMVFSIVIVFIFCYIPSLQHTIDTRQIPVEHWFLPAAFGFGLLMFDEARKYAVRTWPGSFVARMAW
ncbi:calcium ATPase [Dothidotthia symphoricarpi CBS 119687]|uniref:Calcium ATPase n=1 Tax=Dothidotthia symphoricarpi CBS 119687 TaxID=1392245 RepID=A0A6A6AKD8_9PLEO|nr:calcium ATPase [Dothidotthia symphoricarpi CBS 119687]KAF2132016.1 calcium ATPase [Dothidotthia symphoricarpi CBS 119687]